MTDSGGQEVIRDSVKPQRTFSRIENLERYCQECAPPRAAPQYGHHFGGSARESAIRSVGLRAIIFGQANATFHVGGQIRQQLHQPHQRKLGQE